MEKTKEYIKEALEVIKEHKIVFIDHVWGFTSFSKKTAYNHKLHELHDIKDAIKNNRITQKNYLLNKWIASTNATLNIAAFRLMSTTEEHKKLNQSYVDHTTDGEKMVPEIHINLGEDDSKEEDKS